MLSVIFVLKLLKFNQWRTSLIIYYLEELYALLLEILVLGKWFKQAIV